MSVIELNKNYDISGPQDVPEDSLCSSCAIKGKSFLCLVNKKRQYPVVLECDEYTPSMKK